MSRLKFKFDRLFGSLGLLVGIIMIQACSAPFNPEESCNFVQNSQEQRVSWGNQVPVELYLDSSVPYEYYDTIENAAQKWNDLLGRQLLVIRRGGNPGSNRPERDGFSKIFFLEKWDTDRPKTEQGRTTIYWAGPKIYEADVRINFEGFQYFLNADDRNYQQVHLESLLVHEFGHVLGLAHNEQGVSVMHSALNLGQVREDVSAEDVKSLECEY